MIIMLKDISPIEQPADYKVHFGRWNGDKQPLEGSCATGETGKALKIEF